MNKLVIKDLYGNSEKYYGKEIEISGWVRTVRDSKTFGFIEVNDGSFFKNLQIVFDNTLNNFEDICKLTLSSSINVVGDLVKTEKEYTIEKNEAVISIIVNKLIAKDLLIKIHDYFII